MEKPNDYPLADCVSTIKRLQKEAEGKGIKVVAYQKFTCANCGSRQTIEEPNVFHTSGSCEECGFVTDIAERGCNYMLLMGAGR